MAIPGCGQARAPGASICSDDGARTWKAAPKQPAADYINVFYAVPARPDRPGRLYVGTKKGVFLTLDNGATWKELSLRQGRAEARYSRPGRQPV